MTTFSNLTPILPGRAKTPDRARGHFSFWGRIFLLSFSFLILAAAPIFANERTCSFTLDMEKRNLAAGDTCYRPNSDRKRCQIKHV